MKSQTGIMAKKLQKITIFKRLRDVWLGKFFVRYYRSIRKVTKGIHAKTPGLYQVPNWSYDQKLWKITIFKRLRNQIKNSFYKELSMPKIIFPQLKLSKDKIVLIYYYKKI